MAVTVSGPTHEREGLEYPCVPPLSAARLISMSVILYNHTLCVYVWRYICIHLYVCRERERGIQLDISIHIHMHRRTCVYVCIYI